MKQKEPTTEPVMRAETPWAVRSDTLLGRTLPPRVMEHAVGRLCWICLLCAVLATLSILFQSWIQPEFVDVFRHPAVSAVWAVVLLSSAALGMIRRFGLLPPAKLLNLGLGFEVLVAFAIAFSETSLPLDLDAPVLGVSKVALWIAAVGFLIPNRPGVKLTTALVSASMWPLAYFVNLHLYGFDPLPPNRLLAWVHVPYLMALVTYALARRMVVMESAAERARELGSYNLVSLIGSGGMGEVWRAEHRMLARDAAIKLIRKDLMTGRGGPWPDVTRRRFKREAQAIASLGSPHTVYLFDFGVAEDGSFYYVMELLDGISLQLMVDRFGPQPAARVVHLLGQVCESLEEAHRRGLVHRDIKPSNIFACSVGIEYDFAKVLDFGLVKNVSHRDTLHLTTEGTSAGTPTYMAPEIALGEETLDGRADLYGLGCVAYFLLTGSPVFEEKTPTATALAHVQKTPLPPSRRSELPVPEALDRIILRCLEKRPEDRPRSALELRRALGECGAGTWNQERAAEWWDTYLPASSAHRAARRARPAPPDSQT